MARARYYSPRIERPLVSRLYHQAKALGIPMTALTSRLVNEGLARMADHGEPTTPALREDPPRDPRG
jgi:hypothetical protein